MTEVVGLVHMSLRMIYLGLGVSLVIGIVLVVALVRHASASRRGEPMPAVADETAAVTDETAAVADQPPVLTASGPDAIGEHSSASVTATQHRPAPSLSGPWSVLQPEHGSVIELRAPGPGVLGRLRRRPLAVETEGRCPPLKALGHDATPTTRTSKAKRRSATSPSSSRSTKGSARKKATSASASPSKVTAGSRTTRATGAARSRTAATRATARTNGSSGVRRATPDTGTGSARKARSVGNAAKK